MSADWRVARRNKERRLEQTARGLLYAFYALLIGGSLCKLAGSPLSDLFKTGFTMDPETLSFFAVILIWSLVANGISSSLREIQDQKLHERIDILEERLEELREKSR